MLGDGHPTDITSSTLRYEIFFHPSAKNEGGSFLEVTDPKNFTPKVVIDPDSILKNHHFEVISLFHHQVCPLHVCVEMITCRPPVQCVHTLQNVR